jgi:Tfp pilus assembly protein PilF
MRAPPEGWAPSDVLTAASLHAGTGHSLSADLIREGVTGVAGNVAEPYLQSVVRPEVLFPAYLAGFNLVESFYLAMPHLSWQGVVIGDPLCAPFPRPAVDPVLLDPAIDPDTDLPSAFAARRLAQTTKAFPTFPARAVTMWVRARGLLARDDREGAMRAFDQALEAAPGEIAPRIELAQLHEQRQEYDQAVALYRRVVDLAPRNVVALNNLGYALAVRQGRPAEGKPFAERALALLPTQGLIIDTLAWIEHLMGDNVSAATRLAEAIRLEPGSAEIRLHAAIVFAETGARAQAARELKEALRLDPRLESTDDARRLLERLKVP